MFAKGQRLFKQAFFTFFANFGILFLFDRQLLICLAPHNRIWCLSERKGAQICSSMLIVQFSWLLSTLLHRFYEVEFVSCWFLSFHDVSLHYKDNPWIAQHLKRSKSTPQHGECAHSRSCMYRLRKTICESLGLQPTSHQQILGRDRLLFIATKAIRTDCNQKRKRLHRYPSLDRSIAIRYLLITDL